MAINMKKLTAAQLDALIKQADDRKKELRVGGIAKIREKIAAMARAEGYSLEELFGRTKTKTKQKVAAKYSNPADSSQKWSGRGRQPLWFAAALKAGKSERSMLIK